VNVVAMVLDRPSQSAVLETLHPRTGEQVTPSVAVPHPVGELPMVISKDTLGFLLHRRHCGTDVCSATKVVHRLGN
jgi:hypothetical protein